MEDILINRIPKINEDVIIHNRDNEYIVAFKNNNCHLKIDSNVYQLINCIDNIKSLSEIVIEFNNHFETKIDNELAYDILYNKLGYYNIIESDVEKFDSGKSPSYLKLNIILINNKINKIIARPFLFLFKNPLLILVVIFCFTTILFTVVSQYSHILSVLKQVPPQYFFIYLVLMIASSLLHEIGHSAATYQFGGKHGGIGIGFYLFTPVLYSDVSDAWNFNTHKRIIVNLAGIYFELIFSTIIILAAILTGIESLLILPSIIFVKTLFNLNPFFRTDGYWILSDLIRAPGLRLESNMILKSFFINPKIINYSKRNIFFIIYALISNGLILIFLITLFIIYPNSLITFPNDLYNQLSILTSNNIKFDIVNFSKLLLPFTFYFLLIRLLFSLLKKIKKRP